MKAINHELLSQFASRGLSINEGIAIDATKISRSSKSLNNILK
jgi:hypothetical protein